MGPPFRVLFIVMYSDFCVTIVPGERKTVLALRRIAPEGGRTRSGGRSYGAALIGLPLAEHATPSMDNSHSMLRTGLEDALRAYTLI